MKSDPTRVSFFDEDDDPNTCVADANPARAPSSNSEEGDGDDVTLAIDDLSVEKASVSAEALSVALSLGREELLALLRVEELRRAAYVAWSCEGTEDVCSLRRRERKDMI